MVAAMLVAGITHETLTKSSMFSEHFRQKRDCVGVRTMR